MKNKVVQLSIIAAQLWVVVILAAVGLAGCGDRRVAGIEGTGRDPGIEGTGNDDPDKELPQAPATAIGTVTGFGSIYVNGVYFNTDAAEVVINGQPATEEQLKIGMVVTVDGSLEEGSKKGAAARITADQILVGNIQRVEPVDFQRKTLTVLGQTIYLTEDAGFEGVTFHSLAEGERIAVSGFAVGNGAVAATHIAKADTGSSETHELEGLVTALNTSAHQLSLNELTVDYSGAQLVAGAVEQLKQGAFIEVQGYFDQQQNKLNATLLTFKPKHQEDIEGLIFETVVDKRDDALVISLYGNLVPLVYEGDLLAKLTRGSRIVVSGRYQSGVFYADALTVKAKGQELFHGAVTDIDLEQRQFVVLNTVIKVDDFTAFSDLGSNGDRYFNFERLQLGEVVQVLARNEGEQWLASGVKREREREHLPVLRGAIDTLISGTRFMVSGIEVDADVISPEILEQLDVGTRVWVEGDFAGDMTFMATELKVLKTSQCDYAVYFECFFYEREEVAWPEDAWPTQPEQLPGLDETGPEFDEVAPEYDEIAPEYNELEPEFEERLPGLEEWWPEEKGPGLKQEPAGHP